MNDLNDELARHGRSIQIEVDDFFNKWGKAIEYRRVFSRYGAAAKKLNLGLSEFSKALEGLGYIRISETPSHKRYVVSKACELDDEALTMHLMDLENEKK